jgi:hypothetical protein
MNKLYNIKDKYSSSPLQSEALKKWFILYMPRNLENAIANQDKKMFINDRMETMKICDSIDQVDFHYRQYLAGTSRTLHRVLHEVRRLRKCQLHSTEFLMELLCRVEANILEHELYELMEIHLKAKQKIILCKI